VLDRKALIGESFTSVDAVENRTGGFKEQWNREPTPFEWTYTSEQLAEFLEKFPPVE